MHQDDEEKQRVLLAASHWLTRVERSDEETRRAFVNWITTDVERFRAVLELFYLDREIGNLEPEDWHHLKNALVQPETPAPANAHTEGRESWVSGVLANKRATFFRLSGIVAALVTLVFAFQVARYALTPDFRTGIGERRVMQLADGSSVHLNTNSRVRVRFSDHTRSVQLLKGEALFSVAHDAKRPFEVEVSRTRVLAMGTKFNVYRAPEDTAITVLEGQVRVRYVDPWYLSWFRADDYQSEAFETELRANESAELPRADERKLVVREVPAHESLRRLAWTHGHVFFVGAPLKDAIKEMNRYNRTKIQLAASVHGDQRVGGSFKVTEAEAFVNAVCEAFPLRVTWSELPGRRIAYLSPSPDSGVGLETPATEPQARGADAL